jgi:hypothetical protein
MSVSRLIKLLNIKKAEAPLRAYAYLTASMGARSGVSDVLDCLIPFVIAGVAEQDGDAIGWSRLQLFLRSFGLRIPVFVLKQLEQRLEKLGAIEWNPQINAFICKAPKEQVDTTLNIDLAFDAIEEALSFFADRTYSVERPPASDTWSDALIGFLRSESGEDLVNNPEGGAAPTRKNKKVNESFVARPNFEKFIVARFIQEYENDNEIFSKILQVFTGILIEDFLTNIQTLPENANYAAVSIYYDTGVLLRLLGTSGAVLQSTTIEMHNALRGLRCRTFYLPDTRAEVDDILNNFASKRTAGKIHPEIAEALASGDLKESDVVELSGTYSVRLEHMGICLSKLADQAKGQEYQINASELASALVAEADSRRRSYPKKRAENDARAVATILRLRGGHVSGALSDSRHVFVTRNPLLQSVTRQYVVDSVEYYFQGAIPPVLTVEQVATMAWLASSNKLEPIKITTELLANCYNAARPSANWTKEFQSILDKYMAEDPRAAQQLANSAIFLHTARNMAIDATVGQESLLKKLRIQDLLNDAAIREREEAYRIELSDVFPREKGLAAREIEPNPLIVGNALADRGPGDRGADDLRPKRNLNAWISNPRPKVCEVFRVSINIGVAKDSPIASVGFIEPDWRDDGFVELIVAIFSLGCSVVPTWQRLQLPRMGESKTIHFLITAKIAGDREFSVNVYLAKQLIEVQSLRFTVSVAAAQAQPTAALP